MGRVFRKAFRILGLGERKGRWVMEQDFNGDLQVNLAWFFAVFSGVLDWIVLILVWFERSLHSAQVSGQSWPWPLKLMTSRGLERTWIRTGGSGGEWVLRTSLKNSDNDLAFLEFPSPFLFCCCYLSLYRGSFINRFVPTTVRYTFTISDTWQDASSGSKVTTTSFYVPLRHWDTQVGHSRRKVAYTSYLWRGEIS